MFGIVVTNYISTQENEIERINKDMQLILYSPEYLG